MKDAEAKLSDYERTRAENIERNNKRLRELGLISALEEQQSNDRAWKRVTPPRTTSNDNHDGNTEQDENQENVKTKKRKQSRHHTQQAKSSEPTRKSLRVQGKDPEGAPVPHVATHNDDDDYDYEPEISRRRSLLVEECRQARQLAAVRYSQLTDAEQKAAKENPTATYEHCLKRVRTMTEKALANRIRAIERSVGKHCVIKMAIFKSCLQDENMWELAQAASESLERLKALQSPAEDA